MEPITLPAKTIDLWCAWLDTPPWKLSDLERVLSLEERHRAAAFAYPSHRQAAIASQGILRKVLAFYSACAPLAVPVVRPEHGKPRLDPNPAGLELSVAHTSERRSKKSRALVLYAVAHCPIGVDVEGLPAGMWEERMCWTMSGAAISSVEALPHEARPWAAGLIWAGQEAAYKALGRRDLERQWIDVVLAADGLHLVHIKDESQEPPVWKLVSLDLAPEYVAVLCYPAVGKYEIRQRWLEPEERTQ